MNRWLSLGLFTLALCAAVTGCGNKPDDDDPIVKNRPKKPGGGTPVATGPTLTPVKGTSYDGVIKGKVTWDGSIDLQEKINFTKDADYCIKGKEVEITQQAFRVGKNKGLGNVFVWIEPADANSYFVIPDDQLKAFAKGGPKGQVVFRQPHCAFMPHCGIVFPVYVKDGVKTKTGQEFIVENDAQVSHNALIKSTENVETNETISPGRQYTRGLKPDNDPIRISCGVHPWMLGYARAFMHPYAGLTSVGADLGKKVYENADDANFGTYKLEGLPVGTQVRLKVWHEALGWLTPPEGEALTVTKEMTKDFTAKK